MSSAPDVSPAFLVMAVGRRVRAEVDGVLATRGVTLRHVSALGHLAHDPGLSYSELARRAGVTAQSMQATLRRLEELGAIERRTRAGRGRTAELHVTAGGAALRDWARTVVADADRALLAAVPAEHRSAFTAGLLRAFAAVEAARD